MLKDKIFSIGNPRFDVIRPEFSALYKEAVSDIKKKHGKIILINSNFGSCNHFSGANNYFNLLIERKVINTPEDHKYFQTYFSYRKRVMKEIQNALPVLSNSFPDHTIILRPHPSESHQAWQDTAKDLKNVKVLHEGSVIPWMKAADAVIHNFCTTSTEYIAMGGTPIAYRPVIDEALESTLPTVVSIVAHTPEELINAIQDRISNETNPTADTKRLFLASHIANISDIFSVDLLLDQIEKLQNRKTSLLRFVFYGFCYKIKKFLRKIKNLFKKQNNYTTHKFPHITKNELRSMIRHFAEINGNSTPLNIKEIDLNTFLISIK